MISTSNNEKTEEGSVRAIDPFSETLSREHNCSIDKDLTEYIEIQKEEEEEAGVKNDGISSKNEEEEEEEEEVVEEGKETTTNEINQNNPNSSNYVGKKPKWWKALARRKGTKGQRKAIHSMTERGYVLPRLDKYLHVIDIQKLTSILPRGLPLTNDILIPKSESCSLDHPSNGNFGDGEEKDVDTNNIRAETKSKAEKELTINLEIGFGQGENLLTNAMLNPDQFYIGAEIHQPGVGVALTRMKNSLEHEDDDTNENSYWLCENWWGEDESESSPHCNDKNTNTKESSIVEETKATGQEESDASTLSLPYDNLRLYAGDGVKILRFLPPSSVDNIYLTFPDPWPKKSNSQYRVIQEDTIELIRSVLKPGGYFYLATDAIVFNDWTTQIFDIVEKKSMEREDVVHWKEMEVCPNRKSWLPVMSKYELKGIEEGRYTICRCWQSLAAHT